MDIVESGHLFDNVFDTISTLQYVRTRIETNQNYILRCYGYCNHGSMTWSLWYIYDVVLR